MRISGPFAVTLGQALNLRPAEASGVPFDRVIIANASPFLLTVTAGVVQDFIQPFEATLIDFEGISTPVNLVPVLAPGTSVIGGASYVTAVWLLPTEHPPAESYPMTLTSAAVIAALAPPSIPSGPQTGQVTVASSATAISGSGAGRTVLTVYNPKANAAAVFLGWSNGVTTTTGYQLDPGYGLTLRSQDQLYGIVAAASMTVSFDDE